jgi:hypothetical protein
MAAEHRFSVNINLGCALIVLVSELIDFRKPTTLKAWNNSCLTAGERSKPRLWSQRDRIVVEE